MQLHIFSVSQKKGTVAYITKKNRVLLKNGVLYWASKSAISVEKGCFFRPKSAKRWCFFTLGYERGIRFGRELGPWQKIPIMRATSHLPRLRILHIHYNDVIMSTMASQITSLTIVYSTVYWSADHRKYQSSASLAFVCGIHRWPENSPHKWPVTRKMFPFDDVIM